MMNDERAPSRQQGMFSINSAGNVLQFVALLVTVIALAMHAEGRLAAIEQHLQDMDKERIELIQHIDRIEARLDALTLPAR